jgi:hypothetical protein
VQTVPNTSIPRDGNGLVLPADDPEIWITREKS